MNISTRGRVGGDSNRLIAGFVIDGTASRSVLIRAVGPTLANFGVAGTLATPRIELFQRNGLLFASAEKWAMQPNADDIRNAAHAAGAFALTEGGNDSALLLTLLPGPWTVQVGTTSANAGEVLVEVYVLR
jgi:hypothetical protein